MRILLTETTKKRTFHGHRWMSDGQTNRDRKTERERLKKRYLDKQRQTKRNRHIDDLSDIKKRCCKWKERETESERQTEREKKRENEKGITERQSEIMHRDKRRENEIDTTEKEWKTNRDW
jgi:hypothetical protein